MTPCVLFVTSMQARVTGYYDYLWLNVRTKGYNVGWSNRHKELSNTIPFLRVPHQNRAFSEELSLLQDQGMSLALREQIAIYLFKEYLLKIPFFQLASDSVLGMICMQLRQVIYMPSDFVIREGDIGKELFMIVKGVVRVMPPKDEAPQHGPPDGSSGNAGTDTETGSANGTATNANTNTNSNTEPEKILLGEGDFFGEIGVVMEVQRTRSVRAESMAELCILSRDGFNKIMVEFPEFATAMKSLIVKRVGEMWKEGGDKEQIDKMTALADMKMKKAAQTYRNMDKLRVKTRALQSMYPRRSMHGDELSLPESEFELLEEIEAEQAGGELEISGEGIDVLPTIAESGDDDSAHREHSFHAYPTADWHPRDSSRHEYDDQTPLRTLDRPSAGSQDSGLSTLQLEDEQLRQLSDRLGRWERQMHERVSELEAAMDWLMAHLLPPSSDGP